MERDEKPRRTWIICLVLTLGTFALYAPVLKHYFQVYGDSDSILANSHVHDGLTSASLSWAFTTGYANTWQPVTWISHLVDWQFYGSKHPAGHHLTNLLLHIANTLLLFTVLRRLTGEIWRSAIVAALFACHPLHVESVAWIADRNDVLGAFFWLLTLLSYSRYVQQAQAQDSKSKITFGLTLLCFAFGLMSKPVLVTLPFVLMLLDYWPLKRINQKSVREKIPFFALGAIVSVVTFLLRPGGAIITLQKVPLGERFINALMAYAGYLYKTIWPVNLGVFYPFHHWPAWQVGGACGFLLAMTVWALGTLRRRPWFAVGWFLFLGTLVPVIGLVQIGGQSMADRYTYLPLVGIFLAMAWGISEAMADWRGRKPILIVAVTITLTACVVLTSFQLRYWHDTTTLFDHALALTANSPVAEDNFGIALENAGQGDGAMLYYKAAYQSAPDKPLTLYLMGRNLAQKGEFENASDYLREAIHHGPPFAESHFELANALTSLNNFSEAATEYAEAIRLDPDLAAAHNNLGAILMRAGRWQDASAQFREALRLKPDLPESHDQLGSILLQLGQPDTAQIQFAEAVRLNPGFIHARMKLGLVLAQHGELDQASDNFQAILKLEPKNADADYNLAAVYAALNQPDDAAKYFAETVRLQPENADARARLGSALAAQGKFDKATDTYRDALDLKPDEVEALQGLAWILATAPKAEMRNGAEAIRLAERTVTLTSHKQPAALAALDAAYAEAGRFDDAVKAAEETQKVATANNRRDLADQAAKRLELYRAGKPFHG